MTYFTRFKLACILGFAVNFKALAQYDPGASLSLGMGHGQTALSQSVMRNAFANSGSKPSSKANKADYVYLGFSHYREFEQKLFEQVLANDATTDKGKLRSFLTSTRTMHHFDTRTQAYGLSASLLSDLLATGIAWNWEMYHQTTASKQKVINLRNSIAGNMSSDAVKNQVLKLSDEDKRMWILSFMYNNSMMAQQIKNAGKTTPQHKVQLAQVAKQAGVPDIAKVSLK